MRRALVPVAEAVLPFVVVGILWEAFALLGPFPTKLFSGVETIFSTFVRLVGNGILLVHASRTLIRLILAFLLASFIIVWLAIIIRQHRWQVVYLLPLVSIGNHIPGL